LISYMMSSNETSSGSFFNHSMATFFTEVIANAPVTQDTRKKALSKLVITKSEGNVL
jgi:hypothetical protein